MTTAAPQLELDFQIGHCRPWLKVSEIARALRVSEDFVCNLFDRAQLDVVIDLKAPGTARPCYRILRDSFARFQGAESWDSRRSPLPIDETLRAYLKSKPDVLLSSQIAGFLSVSHDLILDHVDAFFDASAPHSNKRFFRATQGQLIRFINQRRLQ